ncbi:MAG TPA: hypothetical protein VMB75_11760, partial [Rhodocyclaceae bacterium]|nr:hypothetical protein [Rhodocyclaceae bacterium]
MATSRFDGEAVLWALAAACQLHHVPFDPVLVRGQFPPPHGPASVCEALAALGFRSGIDEVGHQSLSELAGPCFLAVGQEPADAEEPP